MANVKLYNKILLEKLQAEITLKLGKKISQRDLLDKSIEFVYKRFDEFVSEYIDHPPITNELIKRIEENAIDVPLEHPEQADDELLYGL
ncbi:MAG: hypothetical protein KGD65_11785 [Candidatus Lokiarchaeota archaeon]|nr:hypothetical protein [Candidatus Lokiarchaeota archaeon]